MKRFVDTVTHRFGTSCPYTIADQIGIVVIAEPLGCINGHYSDLTDQTFIHVNADLHPQIMEHIASFLLFNAFSDAMNRFSIFKQYHLCDAHEQKAHAFALMLNNHRNIVPEQETMNRLNDFMKNETMYWNAKDKISYVLNKLTPRG